MVWTVACIYLWEMMLLYNTCCMCVQCPFVGPSIRNWLPDNNLKKKLKELNATQHSCCLDHGTEPYLKWGHKVKDHGGERTWIPAIYFCSLDLQELPVCLKCGRNVTCSMVMYYIHLVAALYQISFKNIKETGKLCWSKMCMINSEKF